MKSFLPKQHSQLPAPFHHNNVEQARRIALKSSHLRQQTRHKGSIRSSAIFSGNKQNAHMAQLQSGAIISTRVVPVCQKGLNTPLTLLWLPASGFWIQPWIPSQITHGKCCLFSLLAAPKGSWGSLGMSHFAQTYLAGNWSLGTTLNDLHYSPAGLCSKDLLMSVRGR